MKSLYKTLFLATVFVIGINHKCFSGLNVFQELAEQWSDTYRSIDSFKQRCDTNKITNVDKNIKTLEECIPEKEQKDYNKITYVFIDDTLTMYTIYLKEDRLDNYKKKYGDCLTENPKICCWHNSATDIAIIYKKELNQVTVSLPASNKKDKLIILSCNPQK